MRSEGALDNHGLSGLGLRTPANGTPREALALRASSACFLLAVHPEIAVRSSRVEAWAVRSEDRDSGGLPVRR